MPMFDAETHAKRRDFLRKLLEKDPNQSIRRLNRALEEAYGGHAMADDQVAEVRREVWAERRQADPAFRPAKRLRARGRS